MEAYEICQVWKEAAISRYFCVEFTFHRVARRFLSSYHFYQNKEVENKWHIQLYIENLDHLNLKIW